jgi:hypothetical protein
LLKKARLLIQLVFLIAFFVSYFTGQRDLSLFSINTFLILWALDKVFSWYMGEDFGVHAQLKIRADAHTGIRFAGLSFALLVLYYGIKGMFEHAIIQGA